MSCIFVFGLIMLSTSLAYGAWTAEIHAEGDEVSDNVFQYNVRIGLAAPASESSAPSDSSDYTVKMYLEDIGTNNELSDDIRADDTTSFMWILNIDPNGNTAQSRIPHRNSY